MDRIASSAFFASSLSAKASKPFRRIENAPGGVLGRRADGGEFAQGVHQYGDLFGHRPAAIRRLADARPAGRRVAVSSPPP